MRLDDMCCALWLLDEEKGEKTLSPASLLLLWFSV